MVKDEYQTLVPNLGTFKFVYRQMTRMISMDIQFEPFPVGLDKDGKFLYSGHSSDYRSTLGKVDHRLKNMESEHKNDDDDNTMDSMDSMDSIEFSTSFSVLGLIYS